LPSGHSDYIEHVDLSAEGDIKKQEDKSMADFGDYTWTDAANIAVNGTLTADGPDTFTATISDFELGGTIDVAGLVVNSATLTSDNMLSVAGAGGPTVNLQLDPDAGNYNPDGILFASDGNGGTTVTLEPEGLSSGYFTGPDQLLYEVDPGLYTGTIDYLDNFIVDWNPGDTIDVAGVPGAVGNDVDPFFEIVAFGTTGWTDGVSFASPLVDGSTLRVRLESQAKRPSRRVSNITEAA
jgi:hypothetical protein